MYSNSIYRHLFKELQLEKVAPFSPIFYIGDQGDKFYIILEGEVKICCPYPEIAIIGFNSHNRAAV